MRYAVNPEETFSFAFLRLLALTANRACAIWLKRTAFDIEEFTAEAILTHNQLPGVGAEGTSTLPVCLFHHSFPARNGIVR